jgi:hypothetical protein
MRRLLPLFLAFAFWAPSTEPLPGPQPVSVIQLIASPEKFDGKLISTEGFIHIGFESDMLYLGYEDYQHALLRNAIWFERNPEIQRDREILDINYVGLTGVFVAKQISFAPFATGGITKISKASLVSELKHPITEKFKEKANTPENHK